MKIFKVILPVIILAAGALAAFLMIKARRPVQPEERPEIIPVVRVLRVEATNHQYTVRAQGAVAPRTEINLVTQVPGKLVKIARSFANGGFFDEGEVLVEIEAKDFELAVTRAEAALAEAQVRWQREAAESAVARQEWEGLGKGEANPLLLRVPQLAEAKAGVAAAEANLELARLELERTQVKAPFAGRVWNKRVDVGQYLMKGEVVARVYAVDYAEVRLPLPLDDLAYVNLPLEYRGENREETPRVVMRSKVGQETHEWEGRIVRTEGEIDPKTRMMTAVARIENPYRRDERKNGRPPLAVGMFVEAEIEGKTAGEVVIAPRAALRGNDRLMVVDSESRLRLRPVEIARLEEERVLIRAGLKPGDLICVSPLDAPVDGMRVKTTAPGEELPLVEKEVK